MNKKKYMSAKEKVKATDKEMEQIPDMVPAKRQKRRIFGVSGYLLYSKNERDMRYPEKITVVELANMWSNLSDREKRKWNEKALRIRNRMNEELDRKERERKQAKRISQESQDESEIEVNKKKQKQKNKKVEEERESEKRKPDKDKTKDKAKEEIEDGEKPTQIESENES